MAGHSLNPITTGKRVELPTVGCTSLTPPDMGKSRTKERIVETVDRQETKRFDDGHERTIGQTSGKQTFSGRSLRQSGGAGASVVTFLAAQRLEGGTPSPEFKALEQLVGQLPQDGAQWLDAHVDAVMAAVRSLIAVTAPDSDQMHAAEDLVADCAWECILSLDDRLEDLPAAVLNRFAKLSQFCEWWSDGAQGEFEVDTSALFTDDDISGARAVGAPNDTRREAIAPISHNINNLIFGVEHHDPRFPFESGIQPSADLAVQFLQQEGYKVIEQVDVDVIGFAGKRGAKGYRWENAQGEEVFQHGGYVGVTRDFYTENARPWMVGYRNSAAFQFVEKYTR